ncbi:MAG TPA: ATP-binding protein [Candidatus Paceibacterota bacterium]|jgi:signal transduction histidine kinase/CheY-like chemotaxis protein|nr:ATP-binding protein [Candidatus Paceibacterota bacterium]
MASSRSSVFTFVKREFRLRNLLIYCIVFLACFGSAKLGQFLFFDLHTSPALIWPSFGIALGAILVGGYRMWLPVALAELLAVSSLGMSPLPLMLGATIGQTIQPLIGAWVMRRLNFDLKLSRLLDAFILIGVGLVSAAIAPTISTLAGFLAHPLVGDLYANWIRTWSGGALSILILTPFITVWLPPYPLDYTRAKFTEVWVAMVLLAAITAFTAWTPYGANYGLTAVYGILALLVWIALRTEPRMLTLAMLLLAAISMTGAFFYLPAGASLNAQLFNQELFIEFLATIYLVIAALAEERRRDRLTLQRSVRQLEFALRRIEGDDVAKNQFIATLAHELRNPLAPVVSALDLLSLQDPSPEAARTIEVAQREIGVMRRILDDILEVARVSQHKFTLQKETLDVRPILERCIETTRNFMRNRKHTVTLALPDDAVILETDPVRFEQIITNLLNNAGKYTPTGGRIEIACEKLGSQAVIRVRDNGIGIPPQSLTEIFEPFRQVQTTSQIGTGLGIGLWLTKRLVEMHGGVIEAKSEGLGRGACFTVYLPLREGPIAGPKASTPTPVLQPFKILIVDDNESAAEALQKLLKLRGNEVHVSFDGRSARTAALELEPRVLLLDIGLPDMSGYDVAKELREQGSKATLIALTGYGQEEDKKSAMNAGFDYHLTKPVGIADIERILGELTP